MPLARTASACWMHLPVQKHGPGQCAEVRYPCGVQNLPGHCVSLSAYAASECACPALLQAGGWLGRVYMLDFGTTGIDRYVTLGSPHAPPPAGAEGVVDQTRGILTFCSDATPGAYHPEVRGLLVVLLLLVAVCCLCDMACRCMACRRDWCRTRGCMEVLQPGHQAAGASAGERLPACRAARGAAHVRAASVPGAEQHPVPSLLPVRRCSM